MTTERVYDIKVNGADSMNELKSAVSELTEKLKSLDQTSKEYLETLKQLTDYQQKLADAMGGISDSAEKTDNSLNGIKETVDSVAESISSLGEDVINSFAEGLAQGMAEAATETAELGDTMNNGVNSVKGLKQEISDLRDKLVTLDKGTDEYKETVKQLIDDQVKLKEVMNAGKNEAQAAEGSYNALTQRMSALKQVWKETTDEATRNEIGQQINEINNQLKAMDASIGNNQRNVGNYKSALEGLDASFVNWKQELRECKEALQQLDPSTQEYADTLARASELTHQMADQQEMIKYSSTDLGDQLSNINGIASNLAAGYSAVNAAMGLFGEENEEVQQAMLKVQQAMALVQGLQGIDGFIKRTKGLSQSMGLVTKATQANTVATKANATASKADAVAKGAETVATKAAVPAQLSLNAAMKANPIGFIIGLIATLVTTMMLLKDKIMEMIGANKDMSAAFDKVKAVLAGVGNVIKKSVINPIKMAIIPIKTLAKVMIDLFKGDWSKIGDDIKEGFTEMKDNVVDTINVVGAFKEGYDKKTAEQNEAARKKEAEARAKDRDAYIKDMEAKYGSTWKYTEEGQKAYEEYFKNLKEMYDKDTEDFKQAQRDQWAYEREIQEKKEEEKEKQAKADADAAKKQEEENKRIAKANADAQKKALESFKSSFEKYLNFADVVNKTTMDLETVWKNGSNLYKSYLMENYKYTLEEADRVIKELDEKNKKELWDLIAKGERQELDKIISDIETETKITLDHLDAALEAKEFKIGIGFPEEELDNTITKMTLKIATLKSEFGKVDDTIQHFVEEFARINKIDLSLLDEDGILNLKKQISDISPEFKKLIEQQLKLNTDIIKAQTEQSQKISDVYKRLLDEETTEMQKAYDEAYKYSEKRNELSRTEAERISEELGFVTDAYINNSIQQYNRGKEEINSYYDELKSFYERMEATYLEYAESEFLSEEEKKNATEEAEKYRTLITKTQADRRIEILKNEIDAVKTWKDQFKSLVSTAADSLGSIADYYQGVIDLEKIKIDQDLEDKKISEDIAAERYAAMEEEYKKVQNFQAAQAMINGLSAAVSAYQSMASIPYVGPVLGAAAAAAALAAAIVNVQKIKATRMDSPYGGGSGGGGGAGSTNFQLPSVLELEPNMGRNTTDQSNIDELNNAGNGRGKGESAIRAYVVESEVSASQELANKRSQEVTF